MKLEDPTVAQMTASELRALVQDAVRDALQEILGDPDAGLDRIIVYAVGHRSEVYKRS